MNRLKAAFPLLLVSMTVLAQDSSRFERARWSLQKEAAQLDSLYKKCVDYPDSSEFKMVFFEKFPSDFRKLNLIYGYQVDSTGILDLGILYEKSDLHILDLFAKLDCCISKEKYYKKLIKMGIGGKWDADAVNFMQGLVREKVFEKPLLALKVLTNLKPHEVESFFFFFFDEPHPAWKSVPKELKVIEKHDPKIYRLIEKSFKAALEQSGH